MLPIPYAKHCKVTWEESGQGPRYYQINYRTYPQGTAVQTFTREILEAARPHLEQVSQTLASPPQTLAGQSQAFSEVIAPGGSASLALPEGPAAVRLLELRLVVNDPAQLEHSLRSTIVQLKFDGEETVWCPASDFFGSGVGLNPVSNWYRTVRADGTMICRWVMPYAKTGRVTLTNLGELPVKAELHVTLGSWTWNNLSMHFHTTWHYESDLATPPARDWNYIRIAGRGVYVGDTLALFNPVPTWYGEGDEKIWVNGESFPSHMGTGTEDYYNFSFAPRGIMQTPFANQVRVDQPMTQGHNVLTRTRNLDGIPFEQSLKFDFELMSWKPTKLTYAATTYWYAFPNATSNIQPQPKEAASHISTLAEAVAASLPPHKPGAIECETMKVLSKSGDFFVGEQDMEPFGSALWSGGHQLLGKTTAVGDTIVLEYPASGTAPRKLTLYATQAPDFATLRFRVNGQAVAETFDSYAPSVKPAAAFPLGVFAPRDGKYELRIEVVGSNPSAQGARYFFWFGLSGFGVRLKRSAPVSGAYSINAYSTRPGTSNAWKLRADAGHL